MKLSRSVVVGLFVAGFVVLSASASFADGGKEKDKVKEQITDLLRTIPSLTIFMIPGGSLLLPVLYKILPEELLKPSSFRNK